MQSGQGANFMYIGEEELKQMVQGNLAKAGKECSIM